MRVAHTPSRARWSVVVGLSVMLGIGLVLLFLLSLATNNRMLYERYYGVLLGINIGVACVLGLVVLWGVISLMRRLASKRFGSKLLLKLAATFALVGVLPGVVIYFVSYQFVSRSIENWFDVKVEGALDAGVNLARITLDTTANAMAERTRTASAQLSQVPDASAGLVLERIKDQLGADDVVLWSASAQAIASTGQSRFVLNPEKPAAALQRAASQQQRAFQIEGLDELADLSTPSKGDPANVRVKTLVQVANGDLGVIPDGRYLQATMVLPSALVVNALKVQEANREYQERALARTSLRSMYIGTLTLSLFLAVFGAVVLAALLGNQLVRPLLVLAEGVREVASGNLRPKPILPSKDELSSLTRSFAEMTQQLLDARRAVERSIRQTDEARQSLQTILDNLTAGVIVLDKDGVVRSSNPGATRILRAPLAACEGKPLRDLPGLEAFADGVDEQFNRLHDATGEHYLDHWQQSFELHGDSQLPNQNSTNLVARGATLPDDRRLLVFDDISEIVSAQRSQAWGEVARRLAHEIKNPLTPIQLSAERLEMKLGHKLEGADQAILKKSVNTIVEQVDAMKRLVNEFRDYARLPAAELQALDLNQLVMDVLHLYGAENALVPVEADLDAAAPRILGDAQQLRQVIHNLLQNAQDATAQAWNGKTEAAPAVRVATRFVSNNKRVRLTIADFGCGFPEHILQKAFEPYVTTKPRGTGLGLAVVKKIADEHGARIEISNRIEGEKILGAQVSLSFAIEEAVAI
ncbi:MAG: ATP-binding protein [Comamonas sp.]